MPPYTDEQIRVLIVDDDPTLLNVIGLFLESTGEISTTLAHEGREALERMESEHFDVCISDFEMPEMDGIRLLEEFRYRGMDLPYILITGGRHGDVASRARTAGAGWIIKKVSEGDSFFQKLIDAVWAATGKGENGHTLSGGHREYPPGVHA
ncbi:MAG: response regulator [Methanofollis sp.]|uniref:response regulator n=1 Tax=Methanofollis sp. TaxID=2052835 RepID=UPI00260B6B1B|nr:response regulator [Methanofollis sp.]MDD4255571.1 response regulator [Methanofollis sp.]